MKTKRLLIVFSLILASFILMLYSTYASAQTAESKSSPPTIRKIAPNSYYYNYNITEVQKEPEGGGEAETFYQYNYVKIKGKPTKRKVLDAIEAAESSTVTAEVEAVATERSTAKTQLADIAALSYAQVDNYVDNTFGNLPVAQKTALKKLYKTVLAMLKQMDLSK